MPVPTHDVEYFQKHYSLLREQQEKCNQKIHVVLFKRGELTLCSWSVCPSVRPSEFCEQHKNLSLLLRVFFLHLFRKRFTFSSRKIVFQHSMVRIYFCGAQFFFWLLNWLRMKGGCYACYRCRRRCCCCYYCRVVWLS